VLEALLKRVDGLEKRLRTEDKQDSSTAAVKEAIVEAIKDGAEKKPPDPVRSVAEITTTSSTANATNGTLSRVSPSDSQRYASFLSPPG
jgi:hypothetical protein